ncbi:amino acid ABC transporter substrate-binding protein [Uliginosibacterium gangwonense]|uniref:amino acid ABC transporter substrate-binding protein n=1 Tax=Uliginosibacterium gangwonense TaxID=392736 RepID=UPI00036EEAD1|nr:amino acid ABC transporter substrate-binding protein [Uliginosibacterium gangwonense]
MSGVFSSSRFTGRAYLAVVLIGAGLAVSVAQAEQIDTLARIRQTQTVIIGNREASRPFSFLDEQKQASGYSVELCQRVVDRLRKDLKLPNLKAQYVTVSGAERIPKLASGAIDMECGSTTNTKARQEKVDFSYTMFVAGMKILSRADASIMDPQSVGSKPVALSKGTTSEKLFGQLRDSELRGMQLQVFNSNADAFKALEAGKVVAFPQDDVLLSGLISSLPDKNKYVLSKEYLSIEPYAIVVRKGDSGLLAEIDHTLADLYSSGEINKIYDRWFNTATIKVPMSGLLKEAITRPAKDTGFAKLLGYSL